MYNKEMIKDFINYGIIASVFLVIPFTKEFFVANVLMLISDLIFLYIIEQREKKDSFELEDEFRYDHWEG